MNLPPRSQIIDELRVFICGELMQHPSYPLRADEKLMSGGLIDSFSVAHIAVFIEVTWGVHVPNPELTVERMDTLELIAARVLQG